MSVWRKRTSCLLSPFLLNAFRRSYDPPKILTEANAEDYKLKEITHCRLAMIAIGGLLHQEFIGQGIFGPTY